MANNDFLHVSPATSPPGSFKLYGQPTGRMSYSVESDNRWTDRAEAEAALARVKSGDETGITFGSFDDGD
jgi:hypothetical protein